MVALQRPRATADGHGGTSGITQKENQESLRPERSAEEGEEIASEKIIGEEEVSQKVGRQENRGGKEEGAIGKKSLGKEACAKSARAHAYSQERPQSEDARQGSCNAGAGRRRQWSRARDPSTFGRGCYRRKQRAGGIERAFRPLAQTL